MSPSRSVPNVLQAFVEHVTWIRNLDRILDELFQNPVAQEIMDHTAREFMHVMNKLTVNSLWNSLSRITEPAQTFGHKNLSVERVVKEVTWTESRDIEARRIKERCDGFHGLVKEGRNKRLAHNDLGTSLTSRGFPVPEKLHKEIIAELERLIRLASEQYGKPRRPVVLSAEGCVIDFRKALGDSLLYRRALDDPRLPESLTHDMRVWRLDLSRKMCGLQ